MIVRKLANFYISCESIFEKLENEIKRKVINIIHEDSDDEYDECEQEEFHTGVKITHFPIFFKTVDSDDDN